MLFFKVECKLESENQPEEPKPEPRAQREKAESILLKSSVFNQKLNGRAYFYFVEKNRMIATIGIICRETFSIEEIVSENAKLFNKWFDTYISIVEIRPTENSIEEVTLDTTRNMLRISDRNGFISDDDEVLEQFELDKLADRYFRNVDFGENLVDKIGKEEIYKETSRLLVQDSFIPELDRIFAGSVRAKATGHPVHYFIQTDDRGTRESMYQLLIQSLYLKGRLSSKRYCFLDIRPGTNFSMTVYDYLYKCCSGGAIVVRYIPDDDSEDDQATSGRETIGNLCDTMRKYRNHVLTIFCLPRECTKAKDIFYGNLGNISFVELKEEFASGERAKDYLKMLAKDNRIRPDKKLYDRIEESESYLTPDLRSIFDEWFNNKLKTSIFPQYKEIETVKHEMIKSEPKGSAYDELMEMIGIDEAKKVILQAISYFKAQKLFADKGMKIDHPSMHMVFSGNPGTAKTTVARLFARIMRDNGMLSIGNLVEVGRGDLIGKYIGWTAPTIQKKFKDAQGGVLFIDEAYSLVDDRDGSFGDEAINTIVQEMENRRNDVVVIFAGYPDKMDGFLRKNPGLRSRIAFHVPFADYSTDELCQIANLIARKKGLKLAEDVTEKLSLVFDNARVEEDFGNGRYVRNVIEKAKMAQAARLLKLDYEKIKKDDIVTICAEDIEMPPVNVRKARHPIGFSMA